MTDSSRSLALIPVAMPPGLESIGIYEGTLGEYEVFQLKDKPLAATGSYRLYVAKNPAGQLGKAFFSFQTLE